MFHETVENMFWANTVYCKTCYKSWEISEKLCKGYAKPGREYLIWWFTFENKFIFL